MCVAVRCDLHSTVIQDDSMMMCYRVLQGVAGCCSVLQCVTVGCSVLQCVAVCCSVSKRADGSRCVPTSIKVCKLYDETVLQRVAEFCSVWQCVTKLQDVAVCTAYL